MTRISVSISLQRSKCSGLSEGSTVLVELLEVRAREGVVVGVGVAEVDVEEEVVPAAALRGVLEAVAMVAMVCMRCSGDRAALTSPAVEASAEGLPLPLLLEEEDEEEEEEEAVPLCIWLLGNAVNALAA